MSVHFAPARTAARSPVARALARRPLAAACNDLAGADGLEDQVGEALRHFARHGMAAPAVAAEAAAQAEASGDEEGRQRWLGVLGAFDRRRARVLAQPPELIGKPA